MVGYWVEEGEATPKYEYIILHYTPTAGQQNEKPPPWNLQHANVVEQDVGFCWQNRVETMFLILLATKNMEKYQ